MLKNAKTKNRNFQNFKLIYEISHLPPPPRENL